MLTLQIESPNASVHVLVQRLILLLAVEVGALLFQAPGYSFAFCDDELYNIINILHPRKVHMQDLWAFNTWLRLFEEPSWFDDVSAANGPLVTSAPLTYLWRTLFIL